MVVENIPGSGKDMVLTGCPVKLSNTPAIAKPVFPKLGEHTDAILQEIGYSPQEIADLKKQGILA
jgi:crotonobetainyl-CoA:carnitine CoA-transferase CaiB-like acyl-CoA transferase